MKKNGKMILALGVAVVLVAVIIAVILQTSGGKLDVVADASILSFQKVLEAAGNLVSEDQVNAGWSLEAPDGSVRFIWSSNFSQSPLYDIMVEFAADPFVSAGLDTTRLPENHYSLTDKLMVGTKLGNDAPGSTGERTPLAALQQIVMKYRSLIGYHTAMDHFNVNLGDGNMFEWAKDMGTNTVSKENQDKDIVFVLNPEPLIDAGVDPENVQGWVYTTVSVDIDGKPTDVYKFLKPFNLQ
ncbi:MAG: hypothetical protein GXY67_00955 [Clostridiales bacterium]|nr:hypothetical protein [Clostridiales bacterium]